MQDEFVVAITSQDCGGEQIHLHGAFVGFPKATQWLHLRDSVTECISVHSLG